MKPGTPVRMTKELKRFLRTHEDDAHVREFGGCVGIVVGPMFPDCADCPEVDVRWIPSGLRYGYEPEELTRARKKFRGGQRIKATWIKSEALFAAVARQADRISEKLDAVNERLSK